MPKVRKAVKYTRKIVNYYGKGIHKYIYPGSMEKKGGVKSFVDLTSKGYSRTPRLDVGKIVRMPEITESSRKRVLKLMKKAGKEIKRGFPRWTY